MFKAPKWFTDVIAPFAEMFTRPTWINAQTLLVGSILAPHKRTVSALLTLLGLSDEAGFARFHRFLSRANWSPLQGSRLLLGQLLAAFVPDGPLLIGLDDTLERRRGKKIAARGIYRDPVRSSHGHFVKASGLRWLSLMLLAPIPQAGRVWALPFLTALVPSSRYSQIQGKRHRTLTDVAYGLLRLVQRWLPERRIIVLADGGFAVQEWLARLRSAQPITVITRLRLDAALYDLPPPRTSGQIGRPRLRGARQPSLAARLHTPDIGWIKTRIQHWYGELGREVEWCSGTALWYHSARKSVYGRWVMVRDPLGRFHTQVLFCTDPEISADDILNWFPMRWQVEVTFEESRAHLGVETGRGWAAPTIARTTPLLLGLFSIVTLLAQRLWSQGSVEIRASAWYSKTLPTFSDALATVRRILWRLPTFALSRSSQDTVKVPRQVFERMSDALCYAA